MAKIKGILSVILVVLCVFSFSSCLKYTSNILEMTTAKNPGSNLNPYENQTSNVYFSEPTTNPYYQNIQPVNPNEYTTAVQPTQPIIQPTQPIIQPTQPVVPEITTAPAQEITTLPAVTDPSSWTTAEILKFTTDAVNKTKAFTSTVTVEHKEGFNVNVTKAPGGAAVRNIANGIIESVVKPTDEVLTFNGGKTVNTEGETVPLLLPKRGEFALQIDGIASATASKSGDNTVISIKVIEEMGTLTNHPKHQAASVGYLDASDVDLGPVKLNYLNITYVNSTIDLVVNSNGYVVSADYKVPIKIDCEGSVMGMTAQIQCEGQQTENWKINW